MKSFYYLSICFCLLFNTSRNYSQCYYVVDMQDSFGDGWNGASLDVSINGSLVSSLTFANGGSCRNQKIKGIFDKNNDPVKLYLDDVIDPQCNDGGYIYRRKLNCELDDNSLYAKCSNNSYFKKGKWEASSVTINLKKAN